MAGPPRRAGREGELRSPVERLLEEGPDAPARSGQALSRRSTQRQRSLEDYLKAGNRPRWMERLVDIERSTADHRRRLARAHRRLAAECGDRPAEFARRWREVAAGWSFDEINDLIGQHNDWFPIERQLPVDPRTRDYVPVNGRSYRRRPLDAGWVLEQFPARPAEG